MAKVTEYTTWEGTPEEIMLMKDGLAPMPPEGLPMGRETKLAIEMLVRRTDELHKGMEKLLGIENDKKRKK